MLFKLILVFFQLESIISQQNEKIFDDALPPILIERNDILGFESIVTKDEGLDSNETEPNNNANINRGFSVLFLCFIVFFFKQNKTLIHQIYCVEIDKNNGNRQEDKDWNGFHYLVFIFIVLVLIVLSIAGGFISYQLVKQQEFVPDVPKARNQLKSEESGD
jgi:hypothetical protein